MTGGADGYVNCTRTADGLSWEWVGGNTIWISRELLKRADDGVFSNRTPATNEAFTMGPYSLLCTKHLIREQVIEAVRLYP